MAALPWVFELAQSLLFLLKTIAGMPERSEEFMSVCGLLQSVSQLRKPNGEVS